MEASLISQVRRFNRTVTQRVGALDDEFLARDRPLGQARVLWEIGPDGADVRSLRTRLDLDSGYLSRLLRALEADGLVVVDGSEADGRVRRARLAGAGRAERAELDRRADDAAASILRPLSVSQRDRLAAAMAEVERLPVVVVGGRGHHSPSRGSGRTHLPACRAYSGELGRRFESGFDPARSLPAADQDMIPPAGLFLVATLHCEAIGCGGLKFHGDAPADSSDVGGPGRARAGPRPRLLTELEARAAVRGVTVLRLETNGTLAEAISLYRSSGYREVAAFSAEPYAHHWFEKTLREPPAEAPAEGSGEAGSGETPGQTVT